MHEEPEDDRFERWCAANGVVGMGQHILADGSIRIFYTRADGSVVDMQDQYGYDALLTPYTPVMGRA